MANTLVYQGGPLGTPSSGDLSNCTGGGSGGALEVWDVATPYSPPTIVVDRGGLWQAEDDSTGSRPVSGNAKWTLVGGTPYVDVVLDPVALTTQPFYDPSTPVGFPVIPDAGSGLVAVPIQAIFTRDDGDAWAADPDIEFVFNEWAGETIWFANISGPALLTSPANYGGFGTFGGIGSAGLQFTDTGPVVIGTLVDVTDGGTFGTRSLYIRTFYQIQPISPRTPTHVFYNITAVVQVSKTFTTTGNASALTGNIDVVGSTGNDGTYTIVSAVFGAGSTVITVTEAIPDATADGWVKQ